MPFLRSSWDLVHVRWRRAPNRAAIAGRRQAPIAVAVSLVLALGLWLVWRGQRELAQDARPAAYLPWASGLVLIIAVCARLPWPARSPATPATAFLPRGRWRWGMVAFAAVASAVLWHETQGRSRDDASLDLVVLWIAAIAALILAVVGPIRREVLDGAYRRMCRNG